MAVQDAVTPLSEPEAIDLVKTCFASATERDIYTVSFHATSLYCLCIHLEVEVEGHVT